MPPLLLASVATLDEARLAAALGAGILDLKRPAEGSLGAWGLDELREAADRLRGRVPLSATIGDLPPVPERVLPAAEAAAATGVDYVKVGFFAGARADHAALVAVLAPLARRAGVVAVLMADQQPDWRHVVPALAAAGFAGAMLDTADKRSGPLRAHLPDAALARFVAATRAHGLLSGLAGSLGLADIRPLAALGPDYLGFRTALCRGSREGELDPAAFQAVREALSRASTATATAGAQRSATT